MNASEKQYPVSRSSQTNLGEPKSSLTSLRRSHTTMGVTNQTQTQTQTKIYEGEETSSII